MALCAAVISDTHGLLRPEVIEYLKKCDVILHAGDFDDEDTLDWIGEFAPLYAVRGNNDWDMANRLPHSLRFQLEDLNFFMVHNCADTPRDLSGTDIFVFGHSHRYYEKVQDGVLWFNPGSCGKRRFGGELSLALLRVDGREYSIEKITLPKELK